MEEMDRQAVARARAGDSDGFRELVERHSRTLFRLAYRMTGSEHDAEDVVQEALLRAYRQLERFEERANFGTWIYRITVNCALDAMRRRNRHERRSEPLEAETGGAGTQLLASEPSPDRNVMNSELKERVEAALERLSPVERSAFVLRHYEGMSIEEISAVLGVRSGAAKHSIFRAVRKMRAALEPVVGAFS